MPNPFAKAGDAEDAAPETPPVEEEQEHPLFVEGDEADADEGDEADAALFDDDEDDDKPVPKATFKKRLDKVIAQREEARRERDQARGELTELRRTVSEARAAYGENPQLMQYDQQFMAKLEEVAKVDADAAKFAKAVDKAIKTGNWEPINKMTTTPSAPASEADATTKSDPKVEKILRQNAARTVDDVLESQGVKPSFGRVLRRHILDTSEDLSELTAEGVLAATKQFIQDNGFTRDDVLAEPGKAGSGQRRQRPATTGRSGGRAATRTRRDASGDPEQPKPAESLSEWQGNRERILRDFEAGSQQ